MRLNIVRSHKKASWNSCCVDEVFGNDVANEPIVHRWFQKSRSEDFDLQNELCGQSEGKMDDNT